MPYPAHPAYGPPPGYPPNPYQVPGQHQGYWPGSPPKPRGPSLGQRLAALYNKVGFAKIAGVSGLAVAAIGLGTGLASTPDFIDGLNALRSGTKFESYEIFSIMLLPPAMLITLPFLIAGGLGAIRQPPTRVALVLVGSLVAPTGTIAFIACTFDAHMDSLLVIPSFVIAIASGVPLLASALHLIQRFIPKPEPTEATAP
jgi:hypothetical protein